MNLATHAGNKHIPMAIINLVRAKHPVKVHVGVAYRAEVRLLSVSI